MLMKYHQLVSDEKSFQNLVGRSILKVKQVNHYFIYLAIYPRSLSHSFCCCEILWILFAKRRSQAKISFCEKNMSYLYVLMKCEKGPKLSEQYHNRAQ